MSSSLKPKSYKLVFAGPVGAGKTTAIQSLSDIEVVRTEARASDDVKKLKDNTTVAMDYGLMKLASGDQVRLYGAPGQKRFDFMWEILTENALGLILMIKGNAPVTPWLICALMWRNSATLSTKARWWWALPTPMRLAAGRCAKTSRENSTKWGCRLW